MDYLDKIDTSVLPIVTPDGTVIWVPTAEYTTQCTSTDNKQAWDCSLKIGSWTQTAYQLSVSFMSDLSTVDLSMWDSELYGYLLESPAGTIETRYYDCCPEPYQHAHFRLRIRVVEGGVASGSTSLIISSVTLMIGAVLSKLL